MTMDWILLALVGMSPQEVLDAFGGAWADVRDYVCVLSSTEVARGKAHTGVYDYSYMKPGWIRVKVLEGDKKGSRVVYNPHTKKVTGRLGGVLGFLSVTTDPTDPKVCSPRGIPLTQGAFGAILMDWKHHLASGANLWYQGEETVEGVACWVLGVDGLDPSGNYGAVKKYLYLRQDNHLPYRIVEYDSGNNRVLVATFRNLRLNTGLTENDFR